MFQFSKHSMEVGGKVFVPDSMYGGGEFGEILNVSELGITVAYKKGTADQRICFYRFGWLQTMYGPKQKPYTEDLNDDIPFEQKVARFLNG